ncbi:hypothetical protein DPMN_143214 [Dreissena polymorpha]|uniref:Uncharacterized protein n=1 Tax=Dreissena polymorpha TaxID=45954 RepID=A0A9D4GCS4_DREPO|nr:hypothetical protein DPMN_143214 [Dreissena polymorpha]
MIVEQFMHFDYLVFFFREYGLGRQHLYTTISDLDTHVCRLTHGNPLLGQRNVHGLLASEGLVVQRSRVAESLTRVDEAAEAMRWSRTIQRRTYRVPGPNALSHIDGNHKFPIPPAKKSIFSLISDKQIP